MDLTTRRRRNLHRKKVADTKRVRLIKAIKKVKGRMTSAMERLHGSLFGN